MARSLDAIIQELDAGYNPTRQLINERINALPAQGDAEIAGLKATQDQAFNDILGGARDRGLGFAGIPLAEQAKYTASSFLPAVARVKQSQNDSRTTLLDALNNTNLDQRKYAMSLQQGELTRDEQTRQFNEQLAASAAARRASAALTAGSFGLVGGAAPSAAAPGSSTDPVMQAAYNDVRTRISQLNNQQILSDYGATLKSANYGNVRDRYKVQLYKQLRPDLFSGPQLTVNNNPAPGSIKINNSPQPGSIKVIR